MTTPSSRGDLGDEIRRRRKARKLTQADLAKLAAVATTNIGKVERGAPVSATTMRAVARALELPAETVAPFIEEPTAAQSTGGPFSGDDLELAILLARRGLTDVEIFRAITDLPKRPGALPTVEPRTGTDR